MFAVSKNLPLKGFLTGVARFCDKRLQVAHFRAKIKFKFLSRSQHFAIYGLGTRTGTNICWAFVIRAINCTVYGDQKTLIYGCPSFIVWMLGFKNNYGNIKLPSFTSSAIAIFHLILKKRCVIMSTFCMGVVSLAIGRFLFFF